MSHSYTFARGRRAPLQGEDAILSSLRAFGSDQGPRIGRQEAPMGGFARYELEGRVVEIPLRWDERFGMETEDYGPFLELSPLYTPEGRPSCWR